MLPKKNRLGRREADILFRRGRRVQHRLAWGCFLPADGEPKMAFGVSGRVRHATTRNRLKRLFREAARGLLPGLREGWLVVVIKAEAEGNSLEGVRECVASLCDQAGMMPVRAQGGPGSMREPPDLRSDADVG